MILSERETNALTRRKTNTRDSTEEVLSRLGLPVISVLVDDYMTQLNISLIESLLKDYKHIKDGCTLYTFSMDEAITAFTRGKSIIVMRHGKDEVLRLYKEVERTVDKLSRVTPDTNPEEVTHILNEFDDIRKSMCREKSNKYSVLLSSSSCVTSSMRSISLTAGTTFLRDGSIEDIRVTVQAAHDMFHCLFYKDMCLTEDEITKFTTTTLSYTEYREYGIRLAEVICLGASQEDSYFNEYIKGMRDTRRGDKMEWSKYRMSITEAARMVLVICAELSYRELMGGSGCLAYEEGRRKMCENSTGDFGMSCEDDNEMWDVTVRVMRMCTEAKEITKAADYIMASIRREWKDMPMMALVNMVACNIMCLDEDGEEVLDFPMAFLPSADMLSVDETELYRRWSEQIK